jgi:hypothetical protein
MVTRRRVCRLQLLLVRASAVIVESESSGTRDQILLTQIRDFPFRRLLRLAGLQWGIRPRLHTGGEELVAYFPLIWHEQCRKRRLQQFLVTAGTSLPNCYLATTEGHTVPQALL